MSFEEDLKSGLISKFPYLEGKVVLAGTRRISVEAAYDKFQELFTHITGELGFNSLCALTGLDEGENLGFIYHLAHENGTVAGLKTVRPKSDAVIKSVTGVFPSAEAYERELVDLFGARVEGLIEGYRYPLADSWPKDEFPLRKDWKPKT